LRKTSIHAEVSTSVTGAGGDDQEESLGLTLQLARGGPLAFRLFVTDAIDAPAA
jgi:hypothetical protein